MSRAATFAILLTGCTSIQSQPPLAGEWLVTAINGHETPASPAAYRMRFDERTVGGQFGCNHFGGDYRVTGDVLTGGALMMTEMACSEPANSFEAWGMAVLRQPARIHWHADVQLSLSNAAGSIELSRR